MKPDKLTELLFITSIQNIPSILRRGILCFEKAERLNHESIAMDVLKIPKAVIADGNASSDYTKFLPAPDGIENLDLDLIFARYWTDADPFTEWRKKRIKCAEVLIPEKIPVNYLIGAYVSNETAKSSIIEAGFDKHVEIKPDMFFR